MAEPTVLVGLAVVIGSATLLAYIAHLMKQPLVLAYVFAGLLIGPGGFGIISNSDTVFSFSELGIAFFLFVIGIQIDLNKIRDIGFTVAAAGLTQIILTFLAGYGLSLFLGFSHIVSVYLGLVMTFSSTLVVVKMLAEKEELDSIHGRIAIGILLLQDVVAIMALAILKDYSSEGLSSVILQPLAMSAGLLVLSVAASRMLLPPLMRFFAHNQELLFLSALSWCFLFSLLAHQMGLSIAIGSYLAGVGIGGLPYNLEIAGLIRGLRDFFATLFFVSLGMQLSLGHLSGALPAIILFSILVLIIKPLSTVWVVTLLGYKSRTSFFSSISLGQVSEFSLILVSTGVGLGVLSPSISSLVAAVTVFTIITTSYALRYKEKLFIGVARPLKTLEEKGFRNRVPVGIPVRHKDHIVLAGCNRMGYSILETLKSLRHDFIVVDLDPDIIQDLMNEGVPCIYGDIKDSEITERLYLKDASIIISTVTQKDDNIRLIEEVRKANPKALVIVTALNVDTALGFYRFGADYVILPKMLAGEKVADIIVENVRNPKHLGALRETHIVELKYIKRQELLRRFEPTSLRIAERRLPP
ncbi:Glutathione-regulated potassium-efflux system protein KefC [uncultured archaeon]|nr:Glutathione-regulated potassium-efflux system protein KefC [uncultured archaeon]